MKLLHPFHVPKNTRAGMYLLLGIASSIEKYYSFSSKLLASVQSKLIGMC